MLAAEGVTGSVGLCWMLIPARLHSQIPAPGPPNRVARIGFCLQSLESPGTELSALTLQPESLPPPLAAFPCPDLGPAALPTQGDKPGLDTQGRGDGAGCSAVAGGDQLLLPRGRCGGAGQHGLCRRCLARAVKQVNESPTG